MTTSARSHRAAMRAVKLLGEHMRTAGVEPEQVLCSSSRRTRETLDGVDPTGERLVERQLYDASCADTDRASAPGARRDRRR